MANERVGRLDQYGFAAEGTKLTAEAAPDCWYPRLSGVIEDKYQKDIVDSAMGTIAKTTMARTVKSWSEGSFEGHITDIDFGWVLGALFGAYPAVTAVAGETAVKDHIFPVTNTNNHSSLTVFKREGAIGTRKFAGCCIENLSINFVKDKILSFSMDVKGKAGAADTDTTTYTVNNVFVPSMFTFKIAAVAATTALTQTALTNAAELPISEATLNFEKGLLIEWNDGAPSLILNQTMGINGSFTLLHTDATYHDFVSGDTNKSLRFDLTHTTTIGNAVKPMLTFDILSAVLNDYSKDEPLADLAKQTITFEAQYAADCAEIAVATLRNTRTSAYS